MLTRVILVSTLGILASNRICAAPPDVLVYGADAESSELATIEAITAPFMNSISSFSAPGELASELAGMQVLLIPEQSLALPSDLQTIGALWAPTLQAWVTNGGVVIQLDGFDSRYLLPAAGLITLSDYQDASNGTVTVVDPSDPLAVGLPGTYTAEFDSVSYSTPDGTVVVRDASNRAVVINKPHGLGNVVIIGHDFNSYNPAMETVLINAVTKLPATLGGLTVTSSGAFSATGYQGGPFDGATQTLTITNAGATPQSYSVTPDQAWLTASPASGTINPGSNTIITLSLDASAGSLTVGSYAANVAISNNTTPATRNLSASLGVIGVGTLPFSDDFESGVFQSAWHVTGTGDAQTLNSTADIPNGGAHHAVLTNGNTGVVSRNELTLTLDLELYEGVVLSFAGKDFSPLSRPETRAAELEELLAQNSAIYREWTKLIATREDSADTRAAFLASVRSGDQAPTNPTTGGADTDALLISADGETWYEVLDFRTSVGQSYATYTVDLDEALGRYGLSYSNRFRIRFNHVGRFGIPADGIAIDDVSVVSNGVRILAAEDAAPSPDYTVWDAGDNGGVGLDPWTFIAQTSGVGGSVGATVASAASVGGDSSTMDTNSTSFILSSACTGAGNGGANSFALRAISPTVGQVDGEEIQVRLQAVVSGTTIFNRNPFDLLDAGDNSFFRLSFQPSDTTWMIRSPSPSPSVSSGISINEPILVSLVLDLANRQSLVTISSLTSAAQYGPAYHPFIDAATTGFPKTMRFSAGTQSNGSPGSMSLILNGISLRSLGTQDGLVLSPLSDPDFVGAPGGPFSPASYDFSVTNSSGAVVDVATSADVNFLNVNPDIFTLLPGQSRTVSILPNNNANGLTPGIHEGTVSILNGTTLSSRERTVRVGVDTKRVLAFTQFADKREEVPNAKSALDPLSTNYFWRTVDFTNELISLLPTTDALLIADQDQGGSLFSVGQDLESSLLTWVQNGGVVVNCSDSSTWQILDGANLMDIASGASANGASVVISNPTDPVAQGVLPYTAQSDSAAFTTSESGVVLSTSGGVPMVLNKRVGAGNVVAIGHDYSTSNIDQDRLLANAIFNLPAGEDLEVTGSDMRFVGFAGESFGGGKTVTLRNLGVGILNWTATPSTGWLDVTPPAGSLGAGASTLVTITPSLSALALSPEHYAATVTFANSGSFAEQTRAVSLFARGTATVPFSDSMEAPSLASVWYATGGGNFFAEPTTQGASVGAQSLGLASKVAFGYARSEATLAVDLRGRENGVLQFQARSLVEPASGPPSSPFVNNANFDGVAISEDEVTWYEVQELRRTPPTDSFGAFTVDLDVAMAAHGILNEGRLFIRFNQFGNARLGAGGGLLIDDISVTADAADDLLVEFGDVAFDGPLGGPFAPTNQSVVLKNISGVPKDWTASPTQPWLAVAPSAGTLNAWQSTALTLSASVAANSLGAARYTGAITVTNTTDGIARTRDAELQVAPRRVVVYTEYSDEFVEVPRALEAVRAIDPHFVVVEAKTRVALVAALGTADTLFIPEVVFADDFTLRAVGVQLGANLSTFLGGGNVIVLATGATGSGNGLRILEEAGIVPPTTTTLIPADVAITVTTPSDPVANLVSDYTAKRRTAAFNGPSGVVVTSSSSGAVVARLGVAGGDVILLGHSYLETTASQSQLLRNALFYEPVGSSVGEWQLFGE